jgi:hypothetical protein
MTYSRKNLRNVSGAIIGMVAAAALGVWQFYLFVTFEGSQGGTGHLWWAIAMALVSCAAGFFVFSVFVRHDSDDDLHITSTRRA